VDSAVDVGVVIFVETGYGFYDLFGFLCGGGVVKVD